MKQQTKYVDKIYRLTRDAAPLSFMLQTRHSRRSPLLHFDEATGKNRPLRYARNQASPYEDEQDDNPIVEPIIFEDGMLRVEKENQVLQKFLSLHPLNGREFVEVNEEKDAEEEIIVLNAEADAMILARKMEVDMMENMIRVVFGKDPSTLTTAEMKRDILVYAKRDPRGFLEAAEDPNLEFDADVKTLVDNSLISVRNNGRDVHYNLPNNKKRFLIVPFGEDTMPYLASYFKTDEGLEALKLLKGN